jgi:predicted dehydrogenase
MMSRLKVVIVGCGYVTRDHIQAWKKVKQADLLAVSDIDKNLAESTAKTWNIPHYYSSLEEMIEQTKPDVVDIATPPQVHAAIAIQAMKSGCNVLIEKPMTITVKDAEEIVQFQKTSGLKAGVIHNWLFEPPVVQTISIVKSGRLGKILSASIHSVNSKNDSMAKNPKHWSHIPPGGRFGEMLAHPIYLLRQFIGECDVANVQTSKLGDYPWMKSDEFFGIYKSNDKCGTAYASFNAPREAIFITVYGTSAILRAEIKDATVTIFPAAEDNRLSKVQNTFRQSNQLMSSMIKNASKVAFGNWESGHQRYIRLFAESIINGQDAPVTIENGLAVVRIVEKTCRMIEKTELERIGNRG